MAKKAKRRGRPLGSKNKKIKSKSVDQMNVRQLRSYIDGLETLLAQEISPFLHRLANLTENSLPEIKDLQSHSL